MTRLTATVLLLFMALMLGACGGDRLVQRDADAEALEDDPFADDESFEVAPANDPFERFNRTMFRFNTKLDKYLLRPVARGYGKVMPRPLRAGIRNFLNNLREPLWVLNSLLQGKGRGALIGVVRFFLNTTIGLGGVLDPATHFFKLPAQREDFGQTLGRWGVPPGPYLVLPAFGPRNLRDGAGDLPVLLHDPNRYAIKDDETRLLLRAADVLEKRLSLLRFDPLLEKQLDPYLFVREVYRQARENEVRDLAPPPSPTSAPAPE